MSLNTTSKEPLDISQNVHQLKWPDGCQSLTATTGRLWGGRGALPQLSCVVLATSCCHTSGLTGVPGLPGWLLGSMWGRCGVCTAYLCSLPAGHGTMAMLLPTEALRSLDAHSEAAAMSARAALSAFLLFAFLLLSARVLSALSSLFWDGLEMLCLPFN